MKTNRAASVASFALLLAIADAAHGQCITEFLASPFSYPGGITTGSDGNLWFTEFDPGSIGRILPATPYTITEFNVSMADIRPAGITSGPDGNLWFVEITGNNVGRITPGSPNTITRFPIPTADSDPQNIVTGPDGNLWFTEAIGKIGRITPNSPNTITEFPIPSGQGPSGITVGPDGNLWFATAYIAGNENGDKIGRITPGSPNTITEFTIPTANGAPGAITTGPDGNLWFTEILGGKIGRITPNAPNTITEFPIPTANSRPFSIITGPDGNIWFGETGGAGKLGRISPDSPNEMTEFTVAGGGLANGPDGNLWFTQIARSVWRLELEDCSKCVSGKLKAIGKKASAKLRCHAQVAKTGDSSGLADCLAKAEGKFSTAFGKAGECGSPEASCESRVDYCVTQVANALPDMPNECEAAKLKAAAKAALKLHKCAAKSATSGKPMNPDCATLLPGTKLQEKLTTAFAKADAAGACSGDPTTVGLIIQLACALQVAVTDSSGRAMGVVCH